ncbi:LuxR C-terminal-related transcriptional regulator [Dactylosporangium sp. NPDC050688]|uniref:LuxR C-terminal-related transcriptional regulator n=1 Tax=Dactylosporangium sp. NPDC050688 TaxID=3157217 RepID=UPI00340B79FE
MGQHVDRVVAPAALGRAVLLGRAAVTLTAGTVGLRLVPDLRPLLAALALVAVTTAAGLDLLAEGLSNAAIAHRLLLTEKTVKNHLHHIFTKLGVSGRMEAVLLWTGRR